MQIIKSFLPNWLKTLLKITRNFALLPFYYGFERQCPVCGKSSQRFRAVGKESRQDAMCVYCGALERHRFVWLYFEKMTDLFDGKEKKMLHIAPERCFQDRLKKHLRDGYITADLLDPRAMVKMDITDIQYPDKYFDVIYCSHVLEHVQNDRKALKELHRVLKPNGWAIINVPITVQETFEDPLIVDPLERLRYFGQEDHVRRYGSDYIERLWQAGFEVDVSSVSDMFTTDQATHMGLTLASGDIYFCSKT
jgi:SAM-dependent methyltransferase